ncbi:MAG: T9SS type A sorting domain-containing protein [Flavobacteriales bacterium]|nr:T9SS type A sorting domain-containing protein [Flavobacteriales bacterium]
MKKIFLSCLSICLAFISYSQTTLYSEDFTSQNGKGVVGTGPSTGPVYDTSGVNWTINVNEIGLIATSDWFQVRNEMFEGQDTENEQQWISDTFDISGYINVTLSLDASEVGTMESLDYLDVEYSTDGGQNFTKIINYNGLGDANHTLIDDFTSVTISQNGLSGTTMIVRISMLNNSGSENTRFDNVLVTGDVAGSLSAQITNATDVTCNGGSDGSMTVTVSNGFANYSYLWSNGVATSNTPSATNTVSGLSAGTYTVTVSDNGGNTTTASATIIEPSVLITTITSTTDASCNGSADGSINTSTNGGTPNYIYNWSNGSTTADISGLSAGTYTLTTTDAAGCFTTVSATITQPTGITVLTDSIIHVSCNGALGSIAAKATGGTGTLTFDWSNGTNYVASSSIVSQSFEGNAGDTWNYVVSPAAYNTSGDVWDIVTSLSSINPVDQASFWGMSDLENSNGGGAFYHTLTFDPVSVSGVSNAVVEFDYHTIGFDNTDEIEFEVVFDNGTSWSTNGTALQKNTTAWTTVSTPIPNGTNHVRLRIQAKQNGSDWAGIDNVKIKVASDTSRSSINNLSAGAYQVTVSDASGCSSTKSFAVSTNNSGCALPTRLRTIFIQDNSATLSWDTVAGAISYKIVWKIAGSPTWASRTFKTGSSKRHVLTGLTSDTKYDWAMMVRTSSGWSGLTKSERFSTLSAPCGNPTNQTAAIIHADQAKLTWTIGSNTISNRIVYRAVGSGTWTRAITHNGRDLVWITGLTPNTNYEWKMKSVCAYNSSGNKWSSINTFKTDTLVAGPKRIKFEELGNYNSAFSIYPNPSNGGITIESVSIESASYEVFDSVGKLMLKNKISSHTEYVDLSNLESGIYIVRLTNTNGQKTERLIIQ